MHNISMVYAWCRNGTGYISTVYAWCRNGTVYISTVYAWCTYVIHVFACSQCTCWAGMEHNVMCSQRAGLLYTQYCSVCTISHHLDYIIFIIVHMDWLQGSSRRASVVGVGKAAATELV